MAISSLMANCDSLNNSMKTVSYVTKFSDHLRVAKKNRKHKIQDKHI